MRWFELSPEPASGGARTARPPPSLGFALGYGALSLGLVSVLAYTIYAYRLIQGTAAMYSSIAVIYLALTGLALGRLVLRPGATGRFALLFALAFLGYAVLWCAFWFGLRGRYHADLWGAAAGLAVMTAVLRSAFGGAAGFVGLFGVLFAFHTLGFALGDVLHALVKGTTGKLLWGAGHGLGFGAGLGYVLHQCQAGRWNGDGGR